MDTKGIVFDIKQLAVFDGPGIRTTVFFKGCPLRCAWCHNPEGLRFDPELMVSENGCARCGKCGTVCAHGEGCTVCGACARICPMGLRRVCGTEYTAQALAETLLRDAAYLRGNGGGYTMSGGEPTAQPDFLLALLKCLRGNHRAVETSGFCSAQVFCAVLKEVEYVILDIKLADSALHKQYTGVDNAPILANLATLKTAEKPFVIRVPVVPGVNDTETNYAQTAALLAGSPNLTGVELLPYHRTAGAKYGMVGRAYRPGFDTARLPRLDTDIFLKHGIACKVL